jgi:2-oxoglutarate ferredoxin oxidoreductase subunit gamma
MNARPPLLSPSETELLLAGFGGQGLLLAGQLLAHAAMACGLEVLVHNYYEGFVRGGGSECTVVLSGEAVGSPIPRHPRICAALDARAAATWTGRVRPGGLLLRNGAEGPRDRSDIRIVDLPVTEIAQSVGNVMTVSMVALGALVTLTRPVPLEACVAALGTVIPARRRAMIGVNEQALRAGAAAAERVEAPLGAV